MLLGVMYHQSESLAKDWGRALYWTQQAVTPSNAAPQFNLANMDEADDMDSGSSETNLPAADVAERAQFYIAPSDYCK